MDLQLKRFWLSQTWGSLYLNPTQEMPVALSKGTGRKLEFNCSCGRTTSIPLYRVTTGNTLSCGKCDFKSKSYWLQQKWGALRLDPTQLLPSEFGSTKNKLLMICDCSRKVPISFKAALTGHTKSCGRCSFIQKSYWLQQKWGSLNLDPTQVLPEEWPPNTEKKLQFYCACGRSKKIQFVKVTTGNTQSCGNCSLTSAATWKKQRWGSLILDPSQELSDEIKPYTRTKFTFICDCSRACVLPMEAVNGGRFRSCGKCSYKTKKFWLQQKWKLLKLDSTQPLPDEWGTGWKTPVKVICDCGRQHLCLFTDLINESTGSCGCAKTGSSELSPAGKILAYVKSLTDAEVLFNDRVVLDGKELDIYIPSQKLAIEYHGLVWHSEKFSSGKRDHNKYLLAQAKGIRLIQIYGDEWEQKQGIIKSQLQELIAPTPKIRIKPVFEVVEGTPTEARAFLDQRHYLGAASGCLTILAKHKSQVIGVWVFMKREKGVILWHRACWDHTYKAWNPHEKALHLAVPILKEMGFAKVVTFADNRFHTGGLYEKLGFIFEKEITPNYYYTDGNIRKSKYSLRVKAGINEIESAEAAGWYRVWDSGKKRFSLPL